MVLASFNCNPDALVQAVHGFHGKRVLVVGDLMLDRFIWGSVSRISPEAPVPVVEIRKESTCLGGAANVSANIRSLGATPIPIGILGDDYEGRQLTDEFRALKAPISGLIVDGSRATIVKTRIIAHHQQVCRADREDKSPIPPEIQRRIRERFRSLLGKAHALIISDYAKGLLTPTVLKEMLKAAKAAGKIVCVDPKLKNFAAYRPATVITPNALEAELAAGMSLSSTRSLVLAGRKIIGQTGIPNVLVTRGEEGMTLFEGRTRVTHIPTVAQEVFDVTGAGDTVISTLSLGLVAGLSMLEAAVLSNIAAGIVVGKLGTASATPDELVARIRSREISGS